MSFIYSRVMIYYLFTLGDVKGFLKLMPLALKADIINTRIFRKLFMLWGKFNDGIFWK